MITLKRNNHIDETKLDRTQSIIFLHLLKVELLRHQNQVHICHEKMYYDVGYINNVFWKCQKMNHMLDCEKIRLCIDYLVKKWGL